MLAFIMVLMYSCKLCGGCSYSRFAKENYFHFLIAKANIFTKIHFPFGKFCNHLSSLKVSLKIKQIAYNKKSPRNFVPLYCNPLSTTQNKCYEVNNYKLIYVFIKVTFL